MKMNGELINGLYSQGQIAEQVMIAYIEADRMKEAKSFYDAHNEELGPTQQGYILGTLETKYDIKIDRAFLCNPWNIEGVRNESTEKHVNHIRLMMTIISILNARGELESVDVSSFDI